MSWLSNFLGTKKLKLPEAKPLDMEMDDYEYGLDSYLRQLSNKNGYEKTIITGRKKPKLAAATYLGA